MTTNETPGTVAHVIQSNTLPGTPVTFKLVFVNADLHRGIVHLSAAWNGVEGQCEDFASVQQAREWLNEQWQIIRETRNHYAKVERTPAPSFGPGFYEVDGTIFKVQESATGNLYAKQLDQFGKFNYAPGAVRTVKAHGVPLTAETAAAYGKLYGICARCGATLTDEESIERGIGPVCATKF